MVPSGFCPFPLEVQAPREFPGRNASPLGLKIKVGGAYPLGIERESTRQNDVNRPQGFAGTHVKTRGNPGPQSVGSRRELETFSLRKANSHIFFFDGGPQGNRL